MKSLLGIVMMALTATAPVRAGKIFRAGFESSEDYAGSYVVKSGQLGTTFHALSAEQVHGGRLAHKAWIRGANSSWRFDQDGPNHRGYPTFQFCRTIGGFDGPTLVTLWVWLDAALKRGEWFSFATLCADPSDRWRRVVCVNLDDRGFVHLMHVPTHGQGRRTFQTDTIRFPLRRWVELKMYIDFDTSSGYAAVWQDGALVSAAEVRGGTGVLEQVHFGAYTPPNVDSAIVYNDDLEVRRVPRAHPDSGNPRPSFIP